MFCRASHPVALTVGTSYEGMRIGNENTVPLFYCFRDGLQQREESGLKQSGTNLIDEVAVILIFFKMKRLNNLMSCLPWSILISPGITHTRNVAQLYRAPFSDGKITLVKNGRLRAEKRGGSMLDMVNREKTPVLGSLISADLGNFPVCSTG